VLNFTEAHGGFMKRVNKICVPDRLILRRIDLHDKCVAGGTGQTTHVIAIGIKYFFCFKLAGKSNIKSKENIQLLSTCQGCFGTKNPGLYTASRVNAQILYCTKRWIYPNQNQRSQ